MDDPQADVFGDWLDRQANTKVVGDRLSTRSSALANFIFSFGHTQVWVGTYDYKLRDDGDTISLPKWAKRYQELEGKQDDHRIVAVIARRLLKQAIEETIIQQ